MENLLTLFYDNPNLDEKKLKLKLNLICENMKWFSDEYYSIQKSLGLKYSAEYLKNSFLSKIDSLITSKFYKHFYTATYIVNNLKLKKNEICIQLTIDQENVSIDQDCYNFIERIKKLGN